MKRKPFCESQMYATGNSEAAYMSSPKNPKSRLFCGAHLNESHCFPCPYHKNEIYLDEDRKTLRIAHRDAEGDIEGRCEDFELPKLDSLKLIFGTAKKAKEELTYLQKSLSKQDGDIYEYFQRLNSPAKKEIIDYSGEPRINTTHSIRHLPYVPNALRDLPFHPKPVWTGMKLVVHFQSGKKKKINSPIKKLSGNKFAGPVSTAKRGYDPSGRRIHGASGTYYL